MLLGPRAALRPRHRKSAWRVAPQWPRGSRHEAMRSSRGNERAGLCILAPGLLGWGPKPLGEKGKGPSTWTGRPVWHAPRPPKSTTSPKLRPKTPGVCKHSSKSPTKTKHLFRESSASKPLQTPSEAPLQGLRLGKRIPSTAKGKPLQPKDCLACPK